MPKVVDHKARRAEIASAVWRVIRREGVAGATVRTVAAEAGWSTGSIRHYFSTRNELLALTTSVLIERVGERVQHRADRLLSGNALPGVTALVELLEETLPVDDERRAESEVWLALVAASRTDESLRAVTEEAHRGLRQLCSDIAWISLGGPPTDDPRLPVEADRLHGLLDGLALHATVHPTEMGPDRVREALRLHVGALHASVRP